MGWVGRLLDDGLDELAANTHRGFVMRLATTWASGLLAAIILSWPVAGAWIAAMTAGEAYAWVSTRQQFLGRKVSLTRRAAHASALFLLSGGWTILGALWWLSGHVEGAVCAGILWMSVIFFAQTHAFQTRAGFTRAGFVIGGVFPAAAMLAVVGFAPNPLHLNLFPILGLLGLALLFAFDGMARLLRHRAAFDASRLAAKEGAERYRMLSDNIDDVIALNSVDGRRIYVSPSVAKTMGYTPEDLMSTRNYTYLHPDEQDIVRQTVTDLASTGGSKTIEYRVLPKDGGELWVETVFSLVHTADGEPQVLSVSRNIAKRKTMEQELIVAREKAEQAAAVKSDFLANMTHELRTPLNAIIGFSGLLNNSGKLTGTDERHARLINDASRNLLELVNGVLDFSRLEAGAVELDPSPFEPLEEARSAAALMSAQAADKGLTMTVVGGGGEGPLMGDAPRMRQVLLNFLSNAIKFTASGGITIRVLREGLEDGAERMRMEVQDTGIGIPADQVDNVFERFTQADASVSRRFGGTGLGLAICRKTIELMGGTIGAESREGQGSTFWFEVVLPPAEPEAITSQDAEEIAEFDRPVRLLLVEDVEVNRELISALLAPFDIEIIAATDGVQAVKAMEADVYDLVLMDVQMPIMDGLTATRRIRAMSSESARTTPIVAMTANVLPEQIETCLAAGMDDHLGKPISAAKLLEAISVWSVRRRIPPGRAA
ncbi:MAG: ATP-binding protein [Caulobacteraceae bacterium]